MAIRIFVTRHFDRFARKVELPDSALIEAAMRAERGLVDAQLGRFIIKQRIARSGKGRSSGFRTIIAFRKGDLAVFLFGFEKSKQANIEHRELAWLQSLAESFAEFSPTEIENLVAIRRWRQIHVVH